MVKYEAISSGDGVNVNSEWDGNGQEIIDECVAIVRAMIDSAKADGDDLKFVMTAALGAVIVSNIKEDLEEDEERGNYA